MTTMNRRMFALPLAFSAAVPALNAQRGARTSAQSANPPSIPNSEAEKRILAVLDQVRRAGAVFFAVDEDSGRMLRLLAETTGAKDIAEIGTSTGCSSLWMSMALLKSGGRLTTFEMDAERAATARKHFAQAGVERTVTVVEGDAHENIKKLTGPLDLVFIDADKEGYVDYLNRLLPLVRPGGLILADNVSMAPDYVKAVTTSAALETLSFLRMTLTLKKS